MGICLQRTRPLVERRGQPDEGAFRAGFFRNLGLVSLLDRHRRVNYAS